ncbi:galactose oxidase-like domain-containing protein [Mycolicibacterium cosmeticum]|uniref:galactose oxidase-like domain-containing protein n=1 Tax=Mycolicibacterium cosmeticum TaxID=258533 RepID=UPI003204DD0A
MAPNPAETIPADSELGRWGPVLAFPNAAIHSHVLPDGRVLMWGRRDDPHGTLDPHECSPFIWDPAAPTRDDDPATARTTATPQPTLPDGATKANLFCGGHAFLPDGRLLAVGGHLFDTDGLDQATIFDTTQSRAGTWHPTEPMGTGRWYPTATALPDGGVLVMAGSRMTDHRPPVLHERRPQVWSNGTWRWLTPFPLDSMDLYPRVHLLSDGRVFISGPLESTWLLSTDGAGTWEQSSAKHTSGQRDYAPAVMYDTDKILYIGGGGGVQNTAPTNEAKIVDFGVAAPQWTPTGAMHFPRRQHNATLLADGTVLVTGGTRGSGFNNLDPGQPVHEAEVWDPQTGQWSVLAAESVDRCYHATAVLLPDATVLSAGGGEFKDGDNANDARHTHRDGQIFYPPYLLRGSRPQITAAPSTPIHYGATFTVDSPQAHGISKVTWIRLSSTTHAFNQSQHINTLTFAVDEGRLHVTAPASAKLCPPGHYMLFLLNDRGVPSVAAILQIAPSPLSRLAAAAGSRLRRAGRGMATALRRRPAVRTQLQDHASLVATATGTRVVIGLTATCPYGLGACWGGAHEALGTLPGVDSVAPLANSDDSTAEMFLTDSGLPALDQWVEQFGQIVNGRYEWRGVEVTLSGGLQRRDNAVFLTGDAARPPVRLAPLLAAEKVQWDVNTRAPQPLTDEEIRAYTRVEQTVADPSAAQQITVTGPLIAVPGGYELHVRAVSR